MIFGKTYEEKRSDQERYLKNRCKISKRFAFFPVKMRDGRYVWLRFYYHIPHIAPDAHYRISEIYYYTLDNSYLNFCTEEDVKKSAIYQKWVECGWVKNYE